MHDVVIVGGGVAGCYLASKLPKDLDVLIIERNKKIKVSLNAVNFFVVLPSDTSLLL